MLGIAEKHNKNRNKFIFIPMKVEDLDKYALFQKQKFDLVTMANAFRLINSKESLQQISNVIHDSGWLSIYYYSISGIDGRFKEEFEHWFKNTKQYSPGIIYLFSASKIC